MFDRTKGEWYKDSTYIENIAYSLYIEHVDNKYMIDKINCFTTKLKPNYVHQWLFIKLQDYHWYKNFFIKANNIIRKEKLIKLSK